MNPRVLAIPVVCASVALLACTSEGETTPPGDSTPAARIYRFEPLEVPGSSTQSVPLVLTAGGTIGGYFDDADSHFHGFLRRDGEFTIIDAPGAVDTFVVSAFDDGSFEGDFRDASGDVHAFVFANDTWTTIDVPEAGHAEGIRFEVGTGLGTAAFVMNTAGIVVGEYATDDGIGHGWILDDGVYKTVDHPDASGKKGPNTTLFAATSGGRVVGRVTPGGNPHFRGFVFEKGVFTDLVHPDQGGTFGTQPNGITESGAITGVYSDEANALHGFILEDGTWTTIDYPDAPHSEVHAMDGEGNLTGGWYDEGFHLHGFIAWRE